MEGQSLGIAVEDRTDRSFFRSSLVPFLFCTVFPKVWKLLLSAGRYFIHALTSPDEGCSWTLRLAPK